MSQSPELERSVVDGSIYLYCAFCRRNAAYPDKGLGRASAAAWETQHQHIRPERT